MKALDKRDERDKVGQLADDLVFEFGKGWRGASHFEMIIRMRLKSLLDAAEKRSKHYRPFASVQPCDCDTCRLAAELKGWRAGQEETG